MSSSTENNAASRRHIYRSDVLKMITENPGMVVYRDDIAEKLGLSVEQVSSTVARLRSDKNPISNEIEVVVPSNAWRYVPNQRVRAAARAVNKPIRGSEGKRPGRTAGKTPLTESIRQYFWANPGRVIYVEELQEMMSTDDVPLTTDQVRVGVANARQNHEQFRQELTIVSSGRAWRYDGSDNTEPGDDVKHVEPTSAFTTVNTTSTPSPVASAPTPIARISDDNLLLLEKVGKLDDGSILVRDGEQQLYRLSRM